MQVNCDISSNIHANNIRSQFSGYRGIPSNALVSQLLLVLLNVTYVEPSISLPLLTKFVMLELIAYNVLSENEKIQQKGLW